MNKKSIITTLAIVLIALPVGGALVPHVAHAAGAWSLLTSSAMDIVYAITAGLSGIIFTAAGWFISLCGILLNGVMVATLNMKTIVDQTPAIGIAWRTIRDFSSIFIIFMLLYASISMIIGIKGPSLGNLIKNIIIAGLLINFSLFGTKLVVDASNIISLSFYCAMAPQSGTCSTGNTNDSGIISAFSSSGISNVFMQSLDIQGIIGKDPGLQGNNPELSITLANLGGSFLMVVAGLSFITAAIMFALRIGVLILLMAFSPIYFIAMMMPGTDIEKYAKQWSGALYSMCIFMPVYLFLMYIAVSIINDPKFFSFVAPASDTTSIGLLSAHTVGIILQYIIALIMINAPLAAAVSVAGQGASFINKATESVKKWGQGAIAGGWNNSGGRIANKLAQNENFKDFAGNNAIGALALKGTRGMAANYADIRKKKTDEKVKFGESLGHDEKAMAGEQTNLRNLQLRQAQLKAAVGAGIPTALQAADLAQLKADINTSRDTSLAIETARSKAYAARKKGGKTVGGLYNHVAGSNNNAAAKVQISVEEKEMKRAKEELEDNKTELKTLEREIKKEPINPATGKPQPTASQGLEQTRILGEIAQATATVNTHQDTIAQLNLVK